MLSSSDGRISRVRSGQRLTNNRVVRVNKERQGLSEGPPSELRLRDGDSVPGGRVLPPRERLQQVPNIDEDSSRDGLGTEPVAFDILHLQTSELVLEEECDGPVVRVFPAPGQIIISSLSSLKYRKFLYRIIPF